MLVPTPVGFDNSARATLAVAYHTGRKVISMQALAHSIVDSLGVIEPSVIREAFDQLLRERASLARQQLKGQVRFRRRPNEVSNAA